MELKGVDVSKHNGVINWSKTDVDFAMLRAGYGENSIDSQFSANAEGCEKYGIPFGVYWFSYAINVDEAVEEALKCLDVIKDLNIEYPIAFDFEQDSIRWANQVGVKIDKDLATQIADAFCSTIEKAGYYVMLYSNRDYLINYFDNSLLDRYDLWYARWSKTNDRKCGIWQYTSTGTVAGISGSVDLNISYNDYKVLIKDLGLNKQTVEETELDKVKAERDLYKKKLLEIGDLVNKTFGL